MEEFEPGHRDGASEKQVKREVLRFEEMQEGKRMHFFDMLTLDDIYYWYFENNRMVDALKVVDYCLERHPSNDEFHYRKATVFFDLGNLEDAQTALEKALAFNPSSGEYRFLFAEILSLSGEYESAIEEMQKVLVNCDDPGEIYYQMGLIGQMAGEDAEAEKYFRLAIEAEPGFEAAAAELSFLCEGAGNFSEAVSIYEKLLDELPFSYYGWFNLSALYSRIGSPDLGLDAIEYSLAINEDFSPAWYRKGLCLKALSRYDEAIQCFLESSLGERQNLSVWYNIGECYEKLENLPLARKYFLKCTRISPEQPESWSRLGSVLGKEEKYIEAIHFYRKGLEFTRDPFDIWLGLAMCEYRLGNPVSASEALEKAIFLNPHDVRLWRDWSHILAEEGNLEGACQFLQEGMRSNPAMSELYYLIGT